MGKRTEQYKKEYKLIQSAFGEKGREFEAFLLCKIYKAPTDVEMVKGTVVKKLKCCRKLKGATPPSTKKVKKAIQELMGLKGVQEATASAILHFHNSKIPIMDKYSYRFIVGKKIPSKFTLEKYGEFYNKFCEKYKKRLKGDEEARKINFDVMQKGKKLLDEQKKSKKNKTAASKKAKA
ncbi:MAG: hypothetical protein ABIB71_00055 [Candidatus Woesearchaeota archaeon]